jgi:hypothetical protein
LDHSNQPLSKIGKAPIVGVLRTVRFDPRQTHVIGIDAIIYPCLAFHLVGDDLAFVDQAVSLGLAEAGLLQRLLQRDQIRFWRRSSIIAIDPLRARPFILVRRRKWIKIATSYG